MTAFSAYNLIILTPNNAKTYIEQMIYKIVYNVPQLASIPLDLSTDKINNFLVRNFIQNETCVQIAK